MQKSFTELCVQSRQLRICSDCRREKLTTITFVGFLEALARITCIKPLPNQTYLLERGTQTVSDCFDLLASEGKYVEYCVQHAPQWSVEQTEGRHLDEVLDKLCHLLVARFDVEGTGCVTAKSFRSLQRQKTVVL